MKRAEFITVEDEEDLVVSFAIAPSAYRSLTLLRSPQHEFLLPEEERGATVSFGPNEERDLLVLVHWYEASVVIKTERHEYQLDISAVEDEEIAEAKAVLRKMVQDGTAHFKEA